MSLQFNPGAYESVYENSQNRNQQNRRDLANSINSVPEALLQYVQQQKQQEQLGRQNKLGELTAGIQVANAGGDASKVGNFLNGTGIADQPSPMDQAVNPSLGPWSNPQPEDMPAASTGGSYATPPAPLLNSGQGFPEGSPLHHWDKTMGHLPTTKTTLSDVFPNQKQDYGDVITKMAGGDYSRFQQLTPKQQSLVQDDPRYKAMASKKDEVLHPVDEIVAIFPHLADQAESLKKTFPNGIPDKYLAHLKPDARQDESYQVAGLDKDGNIIQIGSKSGTPRVVPVPGGGRIYPKNASQDQSNAGLYGQRATEADQQINSLISKFDPTSASAGAQGLSFVPNVLKSNEVQAYEQSKRNFVNAILRRESGAAISPTEFESANKQYFPAFGDKPEVLAQKSQNRKTVMEGLGRIAGPMAARSEESNIPKESNQTRVQVNQKTGQKRISYDGGQTWQIQ